MNSQAVTANPGSGFNSYWTMPFKRSFRITMENIDEEDMILYYQVDYTLTEVPSDAAYLHAQYRRSNPLPDMEDFTILEGVSGQGQYAGTYMCWGSNSPGWWGEGEIKFFIDGDEEFPTICGTGTEDYFCGSYGFANPATGEYMEFNTPYAGMPQVIEPERRARHATPVRAVPVAYSGSDSVRAGSARYDPVTRLAKRGTVSPPSGRHFLGGVLVPDRTARTVPGSARQGEAGDNEVIALLALAGKANDQDTARELVWIDALYRRRRAPVRVPTP